MKRLITSALLLIVTFNYSVAAERRQLHEVDVDAFTTDTQASAKGAGDNHIAFVWWIPTEFWRSMFSRDAAMSEADKKVILDAISDVSLLAVVQADISQSGSFDFYTKAEVEGEMQIFYSDSAGAKRTLSPIKKINSDLEAILNVLKPTLGAAMGNLGNNLHFYVLNDKSDQATRLLDPYQSGNLDIQLSRKDDVLMAANIEMPVNSLFAPRKCPNGKEAHISWKYCPWSGSRLGE